MKVGVIGLGQMGKFYLAKLFEDLEYPAEDVIGWDINSARFAEVRQKYPKIRVANSFEEFARSANAFIVTVNTPAHHTVIEGLAPHAQCILLESGTPLLCEKPLASDFVKMKQIRAAARRYNIDIRTALVIGFSPVRNELIKLRDEQHLVLREAQGLWGKNRVGDTRPTAGDRVDELVHMLEFNLGLLGD
ncbi:MAG: Gfo/Idh/MocA family oxidoreductase [Minisyncoccia bacterium]